MEQPNKGSEFAALVKQGLENRDALRSCERHHFLPILDDNGDHFGYYRCAHCQGQVNTNTYDLYMQGKRDGAVDEVERVDAERADLVAGLSLGSDDADDCGGACKI